MLPLYLNALLKSPLLEITPMNSVAKLEDVYPRADERAYAKWVCERGRTITRRFCITARRSA